jgi:uncharacterized membrane protein
MRKAEMLALLVIIVSFAISAYFYPILPDEIATHWNAQGQPNGYSSKLFGLFLVPVMSLVLLGVFLLIPKIDPLRQNIKKFRGYFDNFILVIIFFMFLIHLFSILWNLGIFVDMIQILSPAFALLFYYTGVLIEKSKRNYFIGIRTPWTLSSDRVWDKTAKLGGKLFKAAGIISLLGLLLPRLSIDFVIVPIILFTIYLFVYSYLEYAKIGKKRK